MSKRHRNRPSPERRFEAGLEVSLFQKMKKKRTNFFLSNRKYIIVCNCVLLGFSPHYFWGTDVQIAFLSCFYFEGCCFSIKFFDCLFSFFFFFQQKNNNNCDKYEEGECARKMGKKTFDLFVDVVAICTK